MGRQRVRFSHRRRAIRLMSKQVSLFTKRTQQLPDPPEKEVQEAIVTGFTRYRYRVLVTSRNRQRPRCPHCSRVLTKCAHCQKDFDWLVYGDGCDKGLGDLLIRNDGRVREFPVAWHPWEWLMLEVKPGPTARVRPEQRELEKAGGLVIAWSFEMAWEKVQEYERRRGQ